MQKDTPPRRAYPDLAATLAARFEDVSLRLLSAGILAPSGSGSRLALTAARRGEGVSTIAIGLATTLARGAGQPVLLVDGSLLGARLAGRIGVDAAGTSIGASDLATFVRRSESLGFDLLTLGEAPRIRDGGAADAGHAWRALCDRYRHVLVDAGSLHSETAVLWRAWVDKFALVIDTASTTRDMLQSLRRGTDHGQLALSGFILNKRRYYVPGALYRALT